MNYLAHSLLSCGRPDLILGNMMADFISNDQVAMLDTGVQRGVALHRMIDSYTDTHEEVRKCTRLLMPNHGKYASVAFDLLADWILTKYWDRYTDIPLADHVELVHEVILNRLDRLEDRIQSRLYRIIKHEILTNCTEETSFNKTMEWMDKRTKFPSNFIRTMKDYKAHEAFMDDRFLAFFDEISKEVQKFCGDDPSATLLPTPLI